MIFSLRHVLKPNIRNSYMILIINKGLYNLVCHIDIILEVFMPDNTVLDISGGIIDSRNSIPMAPISVPKDVSTKGTIPHLPKILLRSTRLKVCGNFVKRIICIKISLTLLLL